jgi:hypothetical protein
MLADLDPLDLSAVPAASLKLWTQAVRRMDRDTLDSFVRRTWRAWSPESLRPLAVAVDVRRAELDGE